MLNIQTLNRQKRYKRSKYSKMPKVKPPSSKLMTIGKQLHNVLLRLQNLHQLNQEVKW